MKKIFITATDTDAGKTFVCAALAQALVMNKQSVSVFKPISAGCEVENNQLINGDAKLLSQVANCKQSISNINPIAFKEPIAPHIAALEEGVALTFDEVAKGLDELHAYQPDLLLMEGAGGWRLPLTVGDEYTPTYYLSDVVKTLKMDVILVVGMRLGCLNHALLTAEAIRADGLTIKGWVANDITGNMTRYQENLHSLKAMLPEPLLAEIPYQVAPNDEALFVAIKQIS